VNNDTNVIFGINTPLQ